MKSDITKIYHRKNFGSYITSTISISLVLLMLGITGILILNAKKISDYVKENLSFTIMLNPGSREIDIIKLQKELDLNSFVKSTEYISADKALKNFQKEMGSDLMLYLDENPLPPSIEVRLHAEYTNNDSIAFIEKKYKDNPLIKEIVFQRSLVKQVNDNIKNIGILFLCFGILLFIISIALINNTIRLSVYSKRFIIRTMLLIGSSNSFIRKPFLIKSIFQSIFASIISIVLIYMVLILIKNQTDDIVNLTDNQIFIILSIGLLLVGIILNFIFSYLAVNKYLFINKDDLY